MSKDFRHSNTKSKTHFELNPGAKCYQRNKACETLCPFIS